MSCLTLSPAPVPLRHMEKANGLVTENMCHAVTWARQNCCSGMLARTFAGCSAGHSCMLMAILDTAEAFQYALLVWLSRPYACPAVTWPGGQRWCGIRGRDSAGGQAGLLQHASGHAGLCLTVPLHHDGPQPVLHHAAAPRQVASFCQMLSYTWLRILQLHLRALCDHANPHCNS